MNIKIGGITRVIDKRRFLIAVAVALAFAIGVAVPLWAGAQLDAAPARSVTDTEEQQGAADDKGAAGSGEASHDDWRAMDKKMAESMKAFPAKTEGTGAVNLKPKVLSDGTKEFRLTAKITKWESEPGKVVEAWTYNGMVPGPTLKVDVGDRVKIVVKNELPESTSVHWHGIPLTNANDGVADMTQDPINPGKSFTYTFTADRPAVGWYHSHHDGTKQVAAGQYGVILMGDMPVPDKAKDAKKISQEIPLILQDGGQIGLAINGKAFPATEPIRAKRGEWVKLHYFNAGEQAHPMHLHGLDQLVIAKDGYPLDSPYKADTLLIGAGERYTVLVKADNPGTWAFHCHIFSHAEGSGGMFGMVTAMIVS